LVTPSAPPDSPFNHPDWHHLFGSLIRYVLAPVILLFSGFFTANFVISGQYTWPRTSRVLALTLTVVVLSYEFVYKEHRARTGSQDSARNLVLYACVIPYVIGVAIMLALWKI
ncbi:MAG TPA: hypothetical protein VFS39_07645, partial [Nitrospira sp.]|nr:hypothetical protein [Nitrospira sp.]